MGIPKKITKVRFKENEERKVEMCHNILHQVRPTQDEIKEYDPGDATIMARLIGDLNNAITRKGMSFAQQYLLR